MGKKDILNVDVPKACQTVTDPEAPLALRLQGNLLFGLSRVYEQKCLYLLADLESARTVMRELMKSASVSFTVEKHTAKYVLCC